MSQITTHVLDISLGRPAANVQILLEARLGSGEWTVVGRGTTDGDGRLKDLAAKLALISHCAKWMDSIRRWLLSLKSKTRAITITFRCF